AVLCVSAAFGNADLPDCSGHENSVTLPADRRAVIELVSAGCSQRNVGSIDVRLSTQVGEGRAVYPGHLERGTLGGGRVEGALPGRIYADPGSRVGINFGTSGGNANDPGSVECEVAVSGLLIAN